MVYLKLTFFFIYFCIVNCGADFTNINNKCNSKKTCEECISSPNCAWDMKNMSDIHCKIADEFTNNSDNMINPQNEIIEQKHRSEDRLTPEMVNIKLRPGHPYSFKFIYKEMKQYPVDLYFLMDMSLSMKPYRSKISTVAERLIKAMNKLTTDTRIGFGGFIDKMELPYVNTVPHLLEKPCKECVKSYSFKNHLPLSKNVTQFADTILNTPISANIDGPEASLEALMQVIVCTEEIGWRTRARHLIILSTDDQFHIAGDGKLAGIVKPNDGICHVNSDGNYTHELLQDYPSIGQIRAKAREHNKIIIFIVTSEVINLYNELKNNIPETHVHTFKNDSNIVKLITQIYRNITESVRIINNFPSDFNVKITSNCSDFKDDQCKSISSDETIEFTANITLNQCPTDKNYTRTFYIKPSTIDLKVSVKVEMICKCSCNDSNDEESSEFCNNNGKLECGICNCNPGNIGNKCECSTVNSNLDEIEETSCMDPNNLNPKLICSGVGNCKCGQCFCPDQFSGKYCQCNDELCKTDENICSGHGECECGECKCFNNWTGEKCECTTNTDTCRFKENSQICSGPDYGECKCGKCECKKFNDHIYSGDFCQICATCHLQCNDLIPCVQCLISNNSTCSSNCTKYTLLIKENLNESNYKSCSYREEDGCLITFILNETSTEIVYKKECTVSAGIDYIFPIVSATIIATGIFLLALWKIFAIRQDRKEYAQFQNKRKAEIWKEENPLYKTATTTFENPTFTPKV